MRIAIYGSRHQDEFIGSIAEMLTFLSQRGYTMVIHSKLRDYMRDNRPDLAPVLELSEEGVSGTVPSADLALSIGGDGTFLRTAEWIAQEEIPIIGVNTGHLGFLAPFTIEEAQEEVERFSAGKSNVESRSMLCVETADGSDLGTWPYALNELVLHKRDNASMVTVSARIDRRPLADYLCDGLIISTPTGSTAYNLSAGGPIVHPSAPNFVISPLAAHTLTMRPLVIGQDSMLELKTLSRARSFNLVVDGRSVVMPCGVSLFVTRAPFVVKTVSKPGHDFYETLREKLLWGTTAAKKV